MQVGEMKLRHQLRSGTLQRLPRHGKGKQERSIHWKGEATKSAYLPGLGEKKGL